MSRRRLLATVVLAVLAAAGDAWADYRKLFADAIAARDKGDWTQVATLARQAAAQQPKEGERVRLYGTRFEVYLPHFYLGQALANTGDCAGAIKAFQTSETQGAVKGTDKWAELQRLRAQCEKQVGPAPTRPPAPPTPDLGDQIRRAESEIARAAEVEKAVLDLRRSAAALWQEKPALGARTDQATSTLSSARAALARGKAGSAEELAQAAKLAGEAARELDAVRSEVTARQGELRQAQLAEQARQDEARRQAQARRQGLQQELANLLQSTASIGVGPLGDRPEVRQAADALAQARQKAASLSPDAPPEQIEARKSELQQAEQGLRRALAAAVQTPAPARPTAAPVATPTAPAVTPAAPAVTAVPTPAAAPRMLREAAARYLAADFSGAIEVLTQPAPAEPKAAAVALLLRAASRHALLGESGATDPARRAEIEADVRACRRLDATVEPDTRFFSPLFVELFRRAR